MRGDRYKDVLISLKEQNIRGLASFIQTCWRMEGAPVPRDNTKGSRGNKGKADVQNERTVSMCNHSKLRVVEAKGKKHNWHRVP